MSASDLRRRWKRLTLLSLSWGLLGGALATHGGWAGVLAAPILIAAGCGMYRAGELNAEAHYEECQKRRD